MAFPKTSSEKSKQVAEAEAEAETEEAEEKVEEKSEENEEEAVGNVEEEVPPCPINRCLIDAVNHPRFDSILLRMEAKIQKVMQDPNLQEVEFPECSSRYLRSLASALALHYGLEPHCTRGLRVFVRKKPDSKIPTTTLSDLCKVKPEEKINIVNKRIIMRYRGSRDRGSTNNLSATEPAKRVKTLEEREEDYNTRERIFNEPAPSCSRSPKVSISSSTAISSSISPVASNSESAVVSGSMSAVVSSSTPSVVSSPTSPVHNGMFEEGSQDGSGYNGSANLVPVASNSESAVVSGSMSAVVLSSTPSVVSSPTSPVHDGMFEESSQDGSGFNGSANLVPVASNSESAVVSGSMSAVVSSSTPSVVSSPTAPVHNGMFEEGSQDGSGFNGSANLVYNPSGNTSAQPFYPSGALYNPASFSYTQWPSGQYTQYPLAHNPSTNSSAQPFYTSGVLYYPGFFSYWQWPSGQYTQYPLVHNPSTNPSGQPFYPSGALYNPAFFRYRPSGQYTQYLQGQYPECPPGQYMQYPHAQYPQCPPGQYMQYQPMYYMQVPMLQPTQPLIVQQTLWPRPETAQQPRNSNFQNNQNEVYRPGRGGFNARRRRR